MVDKRGQQMTLGAIIAIVLGIAVLVFLIFGFSSGWNKLWEKVTSSGNSNIDTVVQTCAIQCSTNSKYEFCEEKKTLKFGKDSAILKKDSDDCAIKGSDTKEVGRKCVASCNDLSKSDVIDIEKIGIETCPNLCD